MNRLVTLAAAAVVLVAGVAFAQTQPLPSALDGNGHVTQAVPHVDCYAPAGGGNGPCTYVAPDKPKPVTDLEPGAPITGASGIVSNASAVATLAGVSGKTTSIIGFQCTAAGATAASVQTVTVAGTISGSLTYSFVFPAGVTAQATPLVVSFAKPVPASAANTAITVTLSPGGTGNTSAACAAQGFQF